MTELILVRHGETHANLVGRWQGWSDYPLTSFGLEQAKMTARRLMSERGEITALYTSPLRRALQTASVIGTALELEPVKVDRLKEIDFGDLNDITLEEMASRYPSLFERWKDKTDMAFRWPGGERRSDFFDRVAKACDSIIARYPGERVVAVAHGGTLRACLAHLLPDRLGRWWEYSLDNCGVTRVRVGENGATLLVLNDKAHLPTRKEDNG